MTVGTTQRAKAPENGRDTGDQPCVAGECIWKVTGERRSFADASPHGRRLSAYLVDLAGLCNCPYRPVGRRV